MKFRSFPHTIDIIKWRLLRQIGQLNRFTAAWWGIRLGRGTSFYGRCFFRRYPGTSITIGTNCSFRSLTNSNLIGINRNCIISTQSSTHSATITIGNHCGFSGTVIGAFKSIRLGNNVRCGANTLITDSDWHPEDPRSGPPKEIVIEDNVWLGVNSIVLKGVTIGTNTVIGANSVVTKDIPANVIAAGNPCKVIRTLDQHSNNNPKQHSYEK